MMLGESEMPIISSTSSQVVSIIPDMPGGDYPVTIHNPSVGNSNSDVVLTLDLTITSSSPSSGSFGGGTLLTIGGNGFSSSHSRKVNVCDRPCDVQSSSPTELTCLTPSNESSESTLTCDVSVVQISGSVTFSAAYTYDAS